MINWDKATLEGYIADQIEENLNLDYKGAGSLATTDGKKNEIAKDVSAFANSGGGTIIYGILEYQEADKSHLPEKIDPIDRTQFTKETLEQIINSRISPRITGIKISSVSVDAGNGAVYVVEIPKSTTAHQSSDKRYYKRYNFLSTAMEDYEIKDVMSRNVLTNMKISFRFKHGQKYFEQFSKTNKYRFEFDIIATNMGNKVCNYLDCFIVGNEEVSQYLKTDHKMQQNGTFELTYDNQMEHRAEINEQNFTINIQRIPFGPGTYNKVGELEIMSEFFVQNLGLQITISTDDNRVSKFFEAKDLNIIYP